MNKYQSSRLNHICGNSVRAWLNCQRNETEISGVFLSSLSRDRKRPFTANVRICNKTRHLKVHNFKQEWVAVRQQHCRILLHHLMHSSFDIADSSTMFDTPKTDMKRTIIITVNTYNTFEYSLPRNAAHAQNASTEQIQWQACISNAIDSFIHSIHSFRHNIHPSIHSSVPHTRTQRVSERVSEWSLHYSDISGSAPIATLSLWGRGQRYGSGDDAPVFSADADDGVNGKGKALKAFGWMIWFTYGLVEHNHINSYFPIFTCINTRIDICMCMR